MSEAMLPGTGAATSAARSGKLEPARSGKLEPARSPVSAQAVQAAGTVPWRITPDGLEVLVVHRPAYDDWSWPKGKLDRDELSPAAAIRETAEETGFAVTLGRPLPTVRYRVTTRSGELGPKTIDYWTARVTGGSGELDHEVDQRTWVAADQALDQLSYDIDRTQLGAVIAAHHAGTLSTWALAIVRHAKAISRRRWHSADSDRPLDPDGHARADAIATILAAYGITSVISSPSARCLSTMSPYAASTGMRVRTQVALSEEGHVADPHASISELAGVLERGEPTALCTHGPLLPAMLDRLVQSVVIDIQEDADTVGQLIAARDSGLDKGEVVVCHLVGTGLSARTVAVERHRLGPIG